MIMMMMMMMTIATMLNGVGRDLSLAVVVLQATATLTTGCARGPATIPEPLTGSPTRAARLAATPGQMATTRLDMVGACRQLLLLKLSFKEGHRKIVSSVSADGKRVEPLIERSLVRKPGFDSDYILSPITINWLDGVSIV
jgi:hypothetical protein